MKIFTDFPCEKPHTPLLDKADSPDKLRALIKENQLPQFADELREYLLWSASQSGGHFGAGLGVIELTLALHYAYNTPEDRIVWDVGHQAYPHKILTGRKDRMGTIRQKDGLAAFPKRNESEYDTFGVGHSSTSIGAALGMAIGARMSGSDRKTVAVIGDGAMTAGQAFEALHHATDTEADVLVVLNDNDMSISNSVGGLSTYLTKVLSSHTYTSIREESKKVLASMPKIHEFAKKTEEHVKGMMVPGTLFEELGFNYIGPIDGHNLDHLVHTLENMRDLKGPQLLHVITQKGKGFAPAEADPIGYHAISKIEHPPKVSKPVPPKLTYSKIFGNWLCDVAEQDKRLVGITPAMREGSGMVEFSERFPDQYYDVAIAEQHAVTFAAGLACEKQKPVVAIYSTFLQRAYDQLVHDVAIQNLDVLFAIDRAGLVGQDGPTHAGSFDHAFLRCIPNMVIMAPSNENECRQLLYTGYLYEGPAAVRYPRGTGPGETICNKMAALPIGKSIVKREGKSVAILAFGSMVYPALDAAEELNATVVDMRFVKPLDHDCIDKMIEHHDLIVTVEEASIMGGAGSGVNEYLIERGVMIPTLNLGLPDQYIEQGEPAELLAECGLNKNGIIESIQKRMKVDKLIARA